MKILQLVASMDPSTGGVSEAVRQLSEAAIAMGCQVEAATMDAPGGAFIESSSFPIHPLGPGKTSFAYSPRLLPWLLENARRFDVLVVHGLWQHHSFAARQASRKLNVPYMVFPHGMLDTWFKRTYPLKHLKKWLYWPWGDYLVLRDAAKVCYTTEEERLCARQSFWLYSAKEVVTNLGIASPPADASGQRMAFYSRFPELSGKRLALFMSRIHPKKGCDLAIEAFAQVLASEPDWHLVMAGPDQVGWRAELEQMTAKLGVADRVTFTGMLAGDEKWGALRASEFFFLPSHQENFGVVVAESLASGLPVLISDKINIWREVSETGAGLVAPDTLPGTASLLQSWRSMSSEQKRVMREQTVACFQHKFEIRQAASNLIQTLENAVPAKTADLFANAL